MRKTKAQRHSVSATVWSWLKAESLTPGLGLIVKTARSLGQAQEESPHQADCPTESCQKTPLCTDSPVVMTSHERNDQEQDTNSRSAPTNAGKGAYSAGGKPWGLRHVTSLVTQLREALRDQSTRVKLLEVFPTHSIR